MNLDDLIATLGHRTVLKHIIAGEFADNCINYRNEKRAHTVLIDKYWPMVKELCPGFTLPYLHGDYKDEVRDLASSMIKALEE